MPADAGAGGANGRSGQGTLAADAGRAPPGRRGVDGWRGYGTVVSGTRKTVDSHWYAGHAALTGQLNRGYASGRARWPIEYGLLNQDALWVMDEVQLMDVGLATSAQLQAYRDEDFTNGFRPCYTWWMSATLQPDWLRSVDTAKSHEDWILEPCEVPPEDRSGGLWEVSKPITTDAIEANNASDFAKADLGRTRRDRIDGIRKDHTRRLQYRGPRMPNLRGSEKARAKRRH